MTKTRTKTKPFDVAEHLDDKETIAAYLNASLESGDAGRVAAALGDVARASGMAKVANDTGLSREALYRTLSVDGNPELTSLLKIVASLRLKLSVTAT
jgi:probable addiction module antidote protein